MSHNCASDPARAGRRPPRTARHPRARIGGAPRQCVGVRRDASIGDGILAGTADAVISVPEVFNYGCRRAASTSASSVPNKSINSATSTPPLGDYAHPKVRLPGAGGAPEIADSCGEVFAVVRQSRQSLVEQVDFVTSFGHGRGNSGSMPGPTR